MSWFSNRLSASFERRRSDDEHDDEHRLQGKAVQEDLSELTKTFTRQLWGVASFLAPPPPTSIPEEPVDPSSSSSSSDRHLQPDSQIDPFSPSGEFSLSNELIDVDFQAPTGPAELLQEDASQNSSISNQLQTLPDDQSLSLHQSSQQGFTGVGKDFAELKGSVATGLSRFLKVVRDEIDRNERAKQQSEDVNDEEDDDDDHQSGSPVHARKLPGFNSLFKPLLSSIIHIDDDGMLKRKTADEGLDHEYEEEEDDDPADVHGHRMSRPLNLQQKLGESLGGISKLASSLFPVALDSDDEKDGTDANHIREEVGLTEEVLVFAKNISMHPETWLDFPLFTDDDEEDDFEMSGAQKEHIHEVELASPRLAALRIELCPDYMRESRFWKIYFVLLHSRLSKKDAVLLSTPQIMEARALLLNNLQKEGITAQDGAHREPNDKGTAHSFKIVSLQSATEVPAKDFDQIETLGGDQDRSQTFGEATTDMADEVQNKNVLASTVKLSTLNGEDEEADADRWLHEEMSPHLGSVIATLGNEDDVSFSDLEEDDESLSSKNAGSSKMEGSRNWVDLNHDHDRMLGTTKLKGESKADASTYRRHEPNDWLTVEEDDDFD